ncbi:MAG: hypothetical protein GY953_47835 [bacterium]|nr:hypothetical protein [bacterium]
MRSRFLRVLITAVAVAALALGQSSSSSSSKDDDKSSSDKKEGGGTNTTTKDEPKPPDWRIPVSYYVGGKVQLYDGSPPPPGTGLSVNCGGYQPSKPEMISSKGDFTVQVTVPRGRG